MVRSPGGAPPGCASISRLSRTLPVRASKPCHFPVLSTLVMTLRSAAVTPRPYFALMLIWVSTYQVRFAGGSHWAASSSDLTSLSWVSTARSSGTAMANDLRLDDDQWHAPIFHASTRATMWSAWMAVVSGPCLRGVVVPVYLSCRVPVMYDSDLPAGMRAPEESSSMT